MSNRNNEPKFLAVVTLINKSKPEELTGYQGVLTEMSENEALSGIMLTIPSKVDNRGLNAGGYPLVDILKTLGNGVVSDDAENKVLADSAAKDLLINIKSKNSEASIFSEMLEIEDMHSASIKIDSEKKSAFAKGFYLLRPLLEVLHNTVLNITEPVVKYK